MYIGSDMFNALLVFLSIITVVEVAFGILILSSLANIYHILYKFYKVYSKKTFPSSND